MHQPKHMSGNKKNSGGNHTSDARKKNSGSRNNGARSKQSASSGGGNGQRPNRSGSAGRKPSSSSGMKDISSSSRKNASGSGMKDISSSSTGRRFALSEMEELSSGRDSRSRKRKASPNERYKLIGALVSLGFLFVAELVLFVSLTVSGFLPGLYLFLIALLLLIFLLGAAALLFLGWQRRRIIPTVRLAAGVALSLVVGVGCAWAASAVNQVTGTIQAITVPNPGRSSTQEMTLAVYVKSGDPAQEIGDAAGYAFGISSTEGEKVISAAAAHLTEKVGQEVNPRTQINLPALLDSLTSGVSEAIILRPNYLEIFKENEKYKDYFNSARELYRFTVSIDVDPSSENIDQPQENVEDLSAAPFVAYISGSDTWDDLAGPGVGRSDVNILAVVNPATSQVLLLNTPRDYFVPNPAGGGAMDKLTHLGLYGTDCSMQALSQLYGLDVKYYVQLNFNGFETLINAIGGIDVESDVSFVTSDDVCQIYEGVNHLNGAQALSFVRERYNLPGGDNDRGKNQMKVIKAIVNGMSLGTLVTSYSDILDSMEGMVTMNFSSQEVSDLVRYQVAKMPAWNVQSFAVTGEGGSRETYTMPGMELYVMYQDENLVNRASDLAHRVLNGETLTEVDVAY